MLPLGFLNAAQGQPIEIELKNGDTLRGHLVACDTWMNLTLKDVTMGISVRFPAAPNSQLLTLFTQENGKYLKLKESYVKGNNIKFLRVSDEVIEQVSESQKNHQSGFRGGRGELRPNLELLSQ
ncbi:hypothetical protein CDD80_2241 [Ophiocordyceps camponoti-rufipedis]|uniref:LSM complex subunit LSM4 n=1 Tax=Ophiocordyceps camponoti-rufipedis TaxID=2004952 RepID=A0A2C5XKM8_9HYPO|nr:hypothetical protein CDD80_2241 [Ophiocordyceps camponoti-rufipedis]